MTLTGKEVTEKLNELKDVEVLVCSDTELDEYLNYGILLPSGKKYLTRFGKIIDVDVIKAPNYKFNISLGNLISQCEEIASKEQIKRIYCMTETTYNKYKEQNLIITKAGKEYFRIFENELWLVVKI